MMPAPNADGQQVAQEPRDAAGETAGRHRTEQPSEHRAQDTARNEHDHQQQRQQIAQSRRGAPICVSGSGSGSPLTTEII